MPRAIELESFGGLGPVKARMAAPEPAPAPPIPDEEQPLYLKGFAAGQAAAESAEADAARRRARAALDAVTAIRATHESAVADARAAALAALRALLARLRPAMTARGVADEIVAALGPIVARAPGGGLTLHVPAETRAAVEAAFADAQARLHWDDGLAALDLTAVERAIAATFERVLGPCPALAAPETPPAAPSGLPIPADAAAIDAAAPQTEEVEDDR